MATHTSQIGRYRMVGTLGQGAMGRVYLAEDPFLGVRVAVKLIKRDSMRENEVILMRFRREAALGARIRHPNIVGIYDVGLDPDHGPFMVMEYVSGHELLQHMARTETTPAQRLDWIRQVAGALHSAHGAGIIHRDVKPGNILVNSDGQAKLIDWGVARVDAAAAEKEPAGRLSVEASGEHATPVPDTSGPFEPLSAEPAEGSVSMTITQMGTLIGTPAYTAPELLTGKGGYSPATDLWALAVTAFQVLMGHMPFAATTITATLEAIAYGPVEWLMEADARVQAVFARALAKQPGERFPDFQAFITALYEAYDLAPLPIPGPFAQGASVQAESVRPRRAPRLAREERASLKRIGLATAAVAGVALGAWFLFRVPVQWRDLTVHTQPEGATVYLNDVLLGKSPLDNLRVEDRGGHLKIAKKHYLTYERRLKPTEEFVSVSLQVAPYTVDVETVPEGAELYLDGQPLGPSPRLGLRIVVPGSHVLEVRLPGYRTEVLRLDPARPVPRPLVLKPS